MFLNVYTLFQDINLEFGGIFGTTTGFTECFKILLPFSKELQRGEEYNFRFFGILEGVLRNLNWCEEFLST